MPRVLIWIAVSVLSLFLAWRVAGSIPFLGSSGLVLGCWIAAFVLLGTLLCYFLFAYRQSDDRWPGGWKAVRRHWKGRKIRPLVAAIAVTPLLFALFSYLAAMVLQYGIAPFVASAISTKQESITVACVRSFRNRLQGPTNFVRLETDEEVRLIGVGYLCNEPYPAPRSRLGKTIVIEGRRSFLGLVVDRFEVLTPVEVIPANPSLPADRRSAAELAH